MEPAHLSDGSRSLQDKTVRQQESSVGDEIELVSDGDGLAVIGDAAAVERFLGAADLPSQDLALPRLGLAPVWLTLGVCGNQAAAAAA